MKVGVPTVVQQDAGSILGWHRGLKDPALPQRRHRSQLWLRSDPWPEKPICLGAAEKGGGAGGVDAVEG